jgi:hypothetical protein
VRLLICILALFLGPVSARTAEPATDPVEVMVVGVYHMSNPGRDLHNLKVDDVLAPKRQAQIAAVTDALARFRPDKIAVEWPAATVAERYPKYLDGNLPPSRDESAQLGFRLAKTAGAEGVYGIDVDGEFPFDPVKAYAGAHGTSALLDEQGAAVDQSLAREGALLAQKGVSAALRRLNDPTRLRWDNAFYRTTLRIGGGQDQPGANLLTAWYRRNFLICANLLQLSRPGDRIVVFYGSGHAFLLRQCVSETPGFRLVEPNDYLPR